MAGAKSCNTQSGRSCRICADGSNGMGKKAERRVNKKEAQQRSAPQFISVGLISVASRGLRLTFRWFVHFVSSFHHRIREREEWNKRLRKYMLYGASGFFYGNEDFLRSLKEEESNYKDKLHTFCCKVNYFYFPNKEKEFSLYIQIYLALALVK